MAEVQGNLKWLLRRFVGTLSEYGSVAYLIPGETKAHKHKLFALVNVHMALGQTAGCPRVNRAKKFMCSPRNTGNIMSFPSG